MKILILILFLVGCSVKQELSGLQTLKQECGDLELELASLKAKKWTDTIDKKADSCREHGFWSGKLDKQRAKSTRQELVEDW